MSETLKPGLYRATVRGKINVTVLIDSGGYGTTADLVSAHHVHEQHNIEHARTLIVLDLDGDSASDLVAYLRREAWNRVADQIEAPTRIPEPLRWGSKVSSPSSTLVLLDIGALGRRWIDEWSGVLYAWSDIIDPILIREGVTNSE